MSIKLDVPKLLTSHKELREWTRKTRKRGTLVITNGCFDIIHAGHVDYLRKASTLGTLLVGINSDRSVRQLKGAGRPVFHEDARAYVLSAFEFVSAVYIFPQKRATRFLAEACPHIWVKGGDYTIDSIDKQERKVLLDGGSQIMFIDMLPGFSTSEALAGVAQR